MSKNKEWGSHIELVALADVLGVPILVTTDSSNSDDDQNQVWIYPSDVQTVEVVLLGYSYSSSHYYSLEGICYIQATHNTFANHLDFETACHAFIMYY